MYQHQQRYAKVVKAHRRVIDPDPDYAVAYANLAASYEALGKIKSALLAYDRALQRATSLEFVRDKITALRKQTGREEVAWSGSDGLLPDEPALIDQVVASTMQKHAEH